MLATQSAPTSVARADLCARIQARIAEKHAPVAAVAPKKVHAPLARAGPTDAHPPARANGPARPPKMRRQNGFDARPLPRVGFLDLSDDFLIMIVAELGVERDKRGLTIHHPSTLLPGPCEKDAEQPPNSKDVPYGDDRYVGYGGVWRWAFACTASRCAKAVKATPASPWCAKMSPDFASSRALHAMLQPFFVSPALVRLWAVDLAPPLAPEGAKHIAVHAHLVERATWLGQVEDVLLFSILELAKAGKIPHDRIAVYARVVLARWPDLGQDPCLYRVKSFRESPSGGAVLLTCMEEVCTAGLRLRTDPVVVRSILKRMQDSILEESYDDSIKYMRVPADAPVAPPGSRLEYVARRTEVVEHRTPPSARKRIAWRQEIVEGIEAVGRINGYLPDE